MKTRILQLLASEWQRSPVNFRRLLALAWATLLHLYLLLSLPLLAWLNWQPEKYSLAMQFPELYSVVVDGEEGHAISDLCAYGIAWHETDWLGFDVRIPQLMEGRLRTCFVTPNTSHWDNRLNMDGRITEL